MRPSILIPFIIALGCLISGARSQSNVNDSALSIPMFYATYAFQLPGGDMAGRFGVNSAIGGGFRWKSRSNWLIGAEFGYLFGNQIKQEDQLLSNLKTESGYIIDQNGTFADVSLYERGFLITGNVGKIFTVLSPNPNSGILLMGGFGYLQHKIRIEVLNNTVPQLNGDYKRGYDRLAGGPALTQFLGYLYSGSNRLLSFYGGVDFCEGWTQAKRDVNFDTQEPDEVINRFDLLIGIRIGWIIPVYSREPEKFYYY